jgi:amino acid transporter
MTIIATAVGQPWLTSVEQGSPWGTGMIVENAYGSVGLLLLTFSLTMGIFTGLIGFYVSTSRLVFAMGRVQVHPKVFGKLHSKYKTPMAAIIFTLILTLTAPFFGRETLLWVVDMSAPGVTIAYFYSCFIVYKLFKWSDNGTLNNDRFSIVSPVRKFFALLGTFSSIGFFLLLVVPGSPGFLSTPS